jgi:hypothetical protein
MYRDQMKMEKNRQRSQGKTAHIDPNSGDHICAPSSSQHKKMNNRTEKRMKVKRESEDQTHAKWGVERREDAGGPVVPGRAIFGYQEQQTDR